MKISLQDKKAVGAFLDKKSYDGRVLVSDGGRLTAKWGSLPLIAKWDKKESLSLSPQKIGVSERHKVLSWRQNPDEI